MTERTYSLGFFLGPGFPRGLGTPSIVAADLFAPFFRPSVGGAIDAGTGVPSATGVAALESEALSPLETPDTGRLPEGAGESTDSFGSVDSFGTGDSASGDSIFMTSRSLDEGILRVTSKPGLLPDLRRPSAFGGIFF